MHTGLSRRRFLHLVGIIGGSTAVYQAARGLEFIPRVAQLTPPDMAPLRAGTRKSVLILGAGLGGLAAAYELQRRGYKVDVLESSHRVGGRIFTVRGGDTIDEVGNPQVCQFDREPHLYFNAGPSRIPSDHKALIEYCRDLNIELEPFVNMNRDAWVQDDALFGGRPIRNREYMVETRNFIAELAAKSIKPASLDQPLTAADHEAVLEYLQIMGDLDSKFKSRRSERTTSASFKDVDALQQLFHSKILASGMAYAESEDQSAVMLTPVGGMDRIVDAFMKQVGKNVHVGARVAEIRLQERGVEVIVERDGRKERMTADFCLNSIPMQLLTGLTHNFPAEYATGLASIPRGKYFKLAFQAKERFWERESIYGGISWTTQDISQIWYPSQGIHKGKGIILGAYTFAGEAGDKWARLTPKQRIEVALKQGEKVHPRYREYIENGVSVCWHRMNHMLGCAAAWNESLRAQWFTKLRAPAGHHYLIGDQISDHPSWQEGALHATFHVLEDIDRRVREQAGATA